MSVKQLVEIIIENSCSTVWESAVLEWEIVGFKVDYSCSSKCICGKENIKYLFKIHNIITDVELFPIGSRCIRRFGRDDLSDEVSVCERMDKLLNAVSEKRFISFDSELFSKKFLLYLYANGAFPPSPYNYGNGAIDYQFMLDMFNKRSPLSSKQKAKVSALILNSIIPFCRNYIEQRSL